MEATQSFSRLLSLFRSSTIRQTQREDRYRQSGPEADKRDASLPKDLDEPDTAAPPVASIWDQSSACDKDHTIGVSYVSAFTYQSLRSLDSKRPSRS